MHQTEQFRKDGARFIEWIAQYFDGIENYPVKSQVRPGEIYKNLPPDAPEEGEDITAILNDFEKILLPGITHWQSPNFFAYFPANSSFPSLLAEMLTAALGTQCMKWETSPAAAELEEKMMNWLKTMTGIPQHFQGVIQDTASTATLCAILTAREKRSGFTINNEGFTGQKYKVYCSSEAHSSVEKAVKIAGIGKTNLVKIKVDGHFAIIPGELEKAINRDIGEGNIPLCVVAALGTTGSTAVDPVRPLTEIAQRHGIWLHIDAAFTGSALILPEYRYMIEGIEDADSIVFNPHKWLFTNFDCSAYFVKDRDALIKTFQVVPEYLKTVSDDRVNNYSDWGIQLGRRFRALKLWFVIRNFGVKGLQARLREQIEYARWFAGAIEKTRKFEILAPLNFNLVCFRYIPDNTLQQAELNQINEMLLHNVNNNGEIYLSHTKLNGNFALRLHTSQTYIEKRHVEHAFAVLMEQAGRIGR